MTGAERSYFSRLAKNPGRVSTKNMRSGLGGNGTEAAASVSALATPEKASAKQRPNPT